MYLYACFFSSPVDRLHTFFFPSSLLFFLQENAVMPCVLLSPNRPTLSFYFLISPIPFTVFFSPITIPVPLSQLLGEKKLCVRHFCKPFIYPFKLYLVSRKDKLNVYFGGTGEKKTGSFFLNPFFSAVYKITEKIYIIVTTLNI